ncbi:MAG: site-specific integrase [Candidatus Methanoplasma sp.]|nr:site-specific integrase [Candidatus Methanoplasma sp.]
MVGLFLFCGTRTKELRLAKFSDLNMIDWEFTINHPKGENSYGVVRTVPVPDVLRSVLQRYMAIRSTCSDALFPSPTSDDGFLSANRLRAIKELVVSECGICFDFRMCRRTFGQQYVDNGLDIENVSVLMGHSNTNTTEKFYARRRNKEAIEKAKRTWDANAGRKGDTKNDAGYSEKVPMTGFEPVNSYENGS